MFAPARACLRFLPVYQTSPPQSQVRKTTLKASNTSFSCPSAVVEDPLDFEELSDHARPSLSVTSTTLLDIFSILLGDDLLASLGVVHDGLVVREEAVEAPVEDTSGDE